MSNRIGAVLFDAGGTLFQPEGTVGQIYARAAARHGWEVDAAAIEERFQRALRQMPPLCFPGVPPSALAGLERRWWRRLVAEVMPAPADADFELAFAELFEHFSHASAWRLHLDVVPTLEALRQRGIKLAVVSNFDARLFRICDELRLTPKFHSLIASGRVGFAKPDRRIFQTALRRLGVPPAEAVHVGDSQREDVEGARAAGLRGVLLVRGQPPPNDQGDIIGTLAELPDRL